MSGGEWQRGFHDGACGSPILPADGAEVVGHHSLDWWQGHRRGTVHTAYRAYVRLSYSLDALCRAYGKSEAA